MNQETLAAYLNLIQGLLTCPRGEEWILLRKNEKLVNKELVSIMEQVANHLATEGQIKEAKYLHNWAGKLHHILTESVPIPQKAQDKTEAYIQLIETLLNSPQASHKEILAANQELIGPELVKVMQKVASQIAAEGDPDTAEFLNSLAIDLNRAWIKEHEFEPTLKKEVVDDPWFDSDERPERPSTSETPATDIEETPAREETIEEKPESVTSSVQPKIETLAEQQPQQPQQLQAIADALIKLETTIASRMQPINPLWYMEILEKAEASNWILTTDEVEHLIGIKPQCHHDETSYERGSWTFIKAGKIGAQTGWQVKKQKT